MTEAGVVDTGRLLSIAALSGSARSVRILLQRAPANGRAPGGTAYVDRTDDRGISPLFSAIACRYPRTVRVLIDAGADTKSRISVTDDEGEVIFNLTPLAATTSLLLKKRRDFSRDKSAREDVHKLEAIRRLLLQEEAVHALSWSWPMNALFVSHAAKGTTATKTTPVTRAPKTAVLSTMRWRTGADRVFLATLFRCVVVPSLHDFGDGCTNVGFTPVSI